MRTINVIIEPTAGCNLRCRYCLDRSGSYQHTVMPESVFEKICKIVAKDYDRVQFLWHGGEPLLVGASKLRCYLEIQENIMQETSCQYLNAIQTNGTLIDNEMARLLAKKNFSVGVSFDGLSNERDRGATEAVLRGIRCLRNEGLKVGVASVLSGMTVGEVIENYYYMNILELDYAINPINKVEQDIHEYDLNVNDYTKAMLKLFEIWIGDAKGNVLIDPFATYIKDILRESPSTCWRTSCLGSWICVHPNGNTTPCNREFKWDYPMRSIADVETLAEVFDCESCLYLFNEAFQLRERCLKQCELYDYCQGGCPANHYSEMGDFACKSFKVLFPAVKRILREKPSSIKNPTVLELIERYSENEEVAQ